MHYWGPRKDKAEAGEGGRKVNEKGLGLRENSKRRNGLIREEGREAINPYVY